MMNLIRALALKNVNAILFYHSKTLLYQYTIPFYNSSTSKNSIFIKILFFNPFFIISSHPTVQPHFPGLFNSHFYFSLQAPVQHTTHNTHPLYTDQPIQTHHHTHTYKHIHQPSNKATHKHNPTTKPSHTHKHKHKPIQKSGHRSKTQARPPIHAADQPIHAADLKPRPSIKNRNKLIQKKSSQEQTHSKNIITRTTGANPLKKNHHQSKPIQKTSSLEPRSKPIQ